MQAASLQAAYVLHARRYGDSSLLIELLARDSGRVACVAKGALRARRQQTPVQAFQPLQVALSGRGEVLTLSKAESCGHLRPLTGRNLYCGLYLNELVQKLTARQDACAGLFEDYGVAIRGLSERLPAEPVLRRFEVQMLGHLGLGLLLEQDSQGQPLEASNRYTYEVQTGAVPSTEGSADSVSGRTLLALREGQFDEPASLREARRLMRRILDHHLDGRPLRSRELFR
ncbi:MAG: DNA repair protein RecO [Chromatiaceae bacterium]